jgi:hypothetical protein
MLIFFINSISQSFTYLVAIQKIQFLTQSIIDLSFVISSFYRISYLFIRKAMAKILK